MKKRVFSFMLCLCLLVGLLPLHAVAADAAIDSSGTWGGIDWTLTTDGTLTIAPTKGEPVPDTNAPTKKIYEVGQWREAVVYNSNGGATAIGGYPYDLKKVKKLVIEEGVTYIGSFSAKFPNLTGEVVIPSTVTYIGQEAFQGAPMTKLTFAAGGTRALCIGPGALKALAIEEVKLPADRPEIHLHCWVFNDCTKLKHVTFPANITTFSGWTHVDYCGMSYVNGSDSQILARCKVLETITFGSQAVRDLFFENSSGNRSNINSIGNVINETKTLKMFDDPTAQNGTEYGKKLSSVGLPAGWVWAEPDSKVTVNNSGYMAYYKAYDTDTLDWTYNDGWNATEQRIERTVDVTVTPRNITVAMDDCEIYVGGWPEYSYTVEGLLDGDELISAPGYGTSADLNKPGTYTVYLDGADAGPNYTVTHVEGKLTVKEPAKPTYAVNVSAGVNGMLTASLREACAEDIVTLTVTPNSGYTVGALSAAAGENAVALTKVSDNVYTFKMPAAAVTVSAVFAKIETPKPDLFDNYIDLDKTAWYADGVYYCIENDLMIGIDAEKFAPEAPMTRAALVSVLWRMEGEPKVDHKITFKDVAAGAWYTDAITWASYVGVVNGYSAREFGPDDVVTREQMAAILYRYAAYKVEAVAAADVDMSFSDWKNVSGWAEEAVAWACNRNLIAGKEVNNTVVLAPKDIATRAQTANIIYRFIENI